MNTKQKQTKFLSLVRALEAANETPYTKETHDQTMKAYKDAAYELAMHVWRFKDNVQFVAESDRGKK